MDMLMFALNKEETRPLYEQLYTSIKRAIIDGSIIVHTKLPSKRKLAEYLAVSQTTIELAYGQLLAEGYIYTKPRVGFFVEDFATLPYVEKSNTPLQKLSEKKNYDIDFHPSHIDTDSFPFSVWRKYMKEAIDEQQKELLLTGHAQGEYALREQIAHYLFQSRGVHCTAEQIVIGSGTEQLIPMIMQILGNDNIYALETPGYQMIPQLIQQYNQKIVPVAVDEDGIVIKEIEQSDANVVYVTPSHQFPTGAILSASRRSQLLQWAQKEKNRFIIEDDYDSEFRYTGKPIPSLQSMDNQNNVIYISTFSKSLMPSLRIAYFVLPKTLLPKYYDLFTYYRCTVPRFEQYVLMKFMEDGYFSKHLNRMRKIYRKKIDKILEVTNNYSTVSISGEKAGMHVLLKVNHSLNALELSKAAKEQHIRIIPLSSYLLEENKRYDQQLLLGFGGIQEQAIEENLTALLNSWHIPKQNKKR